MKTALRVALVLFVLCLSSLSAMAQEGGIVVRGNAGADPTAFDPLLTNETVTSDIQALIFPDLLSVDPATASIVNGPGPNALATGWELSDDGLTYTFSLRDDLYWTDGEQIDADDVMFVWDFIQSGAVPTHLSFVADEIANVEKIDNFTIAVSFDEVDCDAILSIGALEPYPSHIAPEDLTTMPDQEFNQNLYVSSGPYTFGEVRPAESISLLANPDYADAELGYVNNDAFVLLNVPDLTVMVERFLAGELSIISGPQEARRAEIYAAEDEGRVQIYTYPGNSWDYLAFNLADPANPQNAVDEDGNAIDQGMHPVFGSTEVGRDVRRALNLALDVDDIITRATFGEGTRMASHLVPASWAFDPTIEPVPSDPALAAQMLTDAGWVNSDPDDPSSVRVCQGCATAEDGTEMRFVLNTNEENARRTAIITIAQESWDKIGVKADIQTLEWGSYLEKLFTQTLDAYVIGWRNGYPDRPDATQLFTPASDVVGGCSNCMSYNNP
ncbi:MAG: ABC transporter substrate-binding protein, partial [Anaerolineaceae bacterium]|nr:ABC transporter substrate-binding protein [Anaerolineaceae bacterium]